MYLLSIFLPFFCFLSLAVFGRYFFRKSAAEISVIFMGFTFFLSLVIFYEVILCNSITVVTLGEWFTLNSMALSWEFIFDPLTSCMIFVITFISLLVHIYSYGYMSEDPHLTRFMSYLSLFTFFMLVLVTSNSFIQLFFGWEGVGVSSYLLINFWYTRVLANKAAMKAIIINKIGDLGLLFGLILVFSLFDSFYFQISNELSPFLNNINTDYFSFGSSSINFLCLFLFIGAMGKSAQIGLHTWLPDAMEGPTPVSALIHAATMVTAGVFLVLRISPILEYSDIMSFIAIIGSLTAIMAASIGTVQNDLKRIIAYSTCSQLGYMFFSCGLSNYSTALFHLTNHAFFKALLFLSAGSVIHALNDEQDIRKMGGLVKLMPFTYNSFIIGSLALTGFPFLSGFYSKDFLLESSLGSYTIIGSFTFLLGILAAAFTAFYSTRLIYYVFISKFNGDKHSIKLVHEPDSFMFLPLFLLCLFSIFSGYLLSELFLGIGVDTWNFSLFYSPLREYTLGAEYLLYINKLLPLYFSFVGAVLFLGVKAIFSENDTRQYKSYAFWYPLVNFLSFKWYFDNYYNKNITSEWQKKSYYVFLKQVDRGSIEHIGPFGLVVSISKVSKFLSTKVYNGLLFNYCLVLVIYTFYMLISTNFYLSFVMYMIVFLSLF